VKEVLLKVAVEAVPVKLVQLMVLVLVEMVSPQTSLAQLYFVLAVAVVSQELELQAVMVAVETLRRFLVHST
jgi:hypothetical protein